MSHGFLAKQNAALTGANPVASFPRLLGEPYSQSLVEREQFYTIAPIVELEDGFAGVKVRNPFRYKQSN